MKQELQERRRRETEGMTDEEVREYIRKGAESFDREMERFRTEKAKKSEPVMTWPAPTAADSSPATHEKAGEVSHVCQEQIPSGCEVVA